MKTSAHLIVSALLVLTSLAARAAASELIAIDVPRATLTWPSDINAKGEIVGFFDDANQRQHGFIWLDGAITVLDVPGATSTTAAGLNDKGDIVGSYVSSAGLIMGFVLHEGRWTTITGPQGQNLTPADINNRGDIVGSQVLLPCEFSLLHDGTFRSCTVGGAPTVIASVNNAGDMVGECCELSLGPAPVAFVLDKHGNVTFPSVTPVGATKLHSGATGINARGDVVGFIRFFFLSDRSSHQFISGFLITNGDVRYIELPGASRTQPSGINDRGDIVGIYSDGGGFHGFLLRNYEN